MVHDLVQLQRKQVIELRNARIDHHLRVFGDGHRAVEYLGYEFLHQVLAAFARRNLFAKPALLDDLIEQTGFLGRYRGRRCLLSSSFSHWSLLLRADFALQLFQLLGIADCFQKQLLKLVVALQRTAKVGQSASQIEHFLQWLDLFGHVARLEVFELTELQVDLQFRSVGIVAQLVLHGEGKMRLHSLQHGVEVVRIHFNKFAILQLGQRLFGVAGEITQYPDYEREFLDLNGAAHFDVVRDLHAGRAHPVQLVLRALSSHSCFLLRNRDVGCLNVSANLTRKEGFRAGAEKTLYISSVCLLGGANVDTTRSGTGQLKNTHHAYRLVLRALSNVKVYSACYEPSPLTLPAGSVPGSTRQVTPR